jgi:hypothetical protein
MNYQEKLQRLQAKRRVADKRIEVIELAIRRVEEQRLHRLASSQKRALSAALAQGHSPQERIEALKRFFEDAKKHGREGHGWREGKRLKKVEEDINSLLEEANTEDEKDALVTYYVHALEAWAILKSKWKEGAQCMNATFSQVS